MWLLYWVLERYPYKISLSFHYPGGEIKDQGGSTSKLCYFFTNFIPTSRLFLNYLLIKHPKPKFICSIKQSLTNLLFFPICPLLWSKFYDTPMCTNENQGVGGKCPLLSHTLKKAHSFSLSFIFFSQGSTRFYWPKIWLHHTVII